MTVCCLPANIAGGEDPRLGEGSKEQIEQLAIHATAPFSTYLHYAQIERDYERLHYSSRESQHEALPMLNLIYKRKKKNGGPRSQDVVSSDPALLPAPVDEKSKMSDEKKRDNVEVSVTK